MVNPWRRLTAPGVRLAPLEWAVARGRGGLQACGAPDIIVRCGCLIVLAVRCVRRSQDESKLSMHVKDSMREHSVADVAAAWCVLLPLPRTHERPGARTPHARCALRRGSSKAHLIRAGAEDATQPEVERLSLDSAWRAATAAALTRTVSGGAAVPRLTCASRCVRVLACVGAGSCWWRRTPQRRRSWPPSCCPPCSDTCPGSTSRSSPTSSECADHAAPRVRSAARGPGRSDEPPRTGGGPFRRCGRQAGAPRANCRSACPSAPLESRPTCHAVRTFTPVPPSTLSCVLRPLTVCRRFISLLQSLVDAPGTPSGLRGAAVDCLGEVVTKRMDAVPKLNLVQVSSCVRC